MTLDVHRKALTIGAAQFDAVGGDITANVGEHVRLIDEAGGDGVDLLVFPELSLSGYARATLKAAPELRALLFEAGRVA